MAYAPQSMPHEFPNGSSKISPTKDKPVTTFSHKTGKWVRYGGRLNQFLPIGKSIFTSIPKDPSEIYGMKLHVGIMVGY